MKEIDMGGFENEEVLVKFAGKEYIIQTDPPAEIYRKFVTLQKVVRKLDSEHKWDLVKGFVADVISFYNKEVDKKKFAKSLTKGAVINFLNSYANIIAGSGQKKVGEK